MDGGGHSNVGDGGDGGGHVRDQVRGVRLAGLGEVDLVSVPQVSRFDAAAGLGVIGGDQALRARRPVFWVPSPHLALHQVEVLDPDLPQDLHLRQRRAARRARRARRRLRAAASRPADPQAHLVPLGAGLGEPGVLGAGGVVPEPVRFSDLDQPVGGGLGERVERRTQRLGDQLQPAQFPGRGQHMRGVGPRPARRLRAAPYPGPRPGCRPAPAARHPPRPDGPGTPTAPRSRSPGSPRSSPRAYLTIDPGPHRLRGLPVGQPLHELQHQHQRQPAR